MYAKSTGFLKFFEIMKFLFSNSSYNLVSISYNCENTLVFFIKISITHDLTLQIPMTDTSDFVANHTSSMVGRSSEPDEMMTADDSSLNKYVSNISRYVYI